MMKSLLIITLGLLISITACAPSPEIIATAMAQTEAALPTETPSPLPTATFTFTPEPPTSTPTLTPTSTPDLQVITADPESIVCANSDLPSGGDYIQAGPFYYQVHYSNDIVIRSGGTLKSDVAFVKEYLNRTGRIDGWGLNFKKTNTGYSGFTFIGCAVAKFQTIAGAQLAVREYNDEKRYGDSYKYLNPDQSIGDVFIALTNVKRNYYIFDFSYRNYRVTITGQGESNLDDLYIVGERILKRLKNEPLSAP